MALAGLLDQFRGKRIVVLGDVMLDEYVFGTVDRISPEAPVMVVRKRSTRSVPGGAANVAKNVVALGGEAVVLGVVGDDENGGRFERSLSETAGITSSVIREGGRATTCKTRIVANHSHQVLRIDEETVDDLDGDLGETLISELEAALEGADGLVLSDYRKGVLTRDVSSRAVALGRGKGVPVVVNAKPESARFFGGASVLTLNRREAESLVGREMTGEDEVLRAAIDGRGQCGVDCLVVTLGDKGLLANWVGGSARIPAPEVEAYDVAGAGDTALATIALGVASVGIETTVFQLAVETSAKVVQHVGVAVPSAGDLAAIRSLG